jgi:hypothetical protein
MLPKRKNGISFGKLSRIDTKRAEALSEKEFIGLWEVVREG